MSKLDTIARRSAAELVASVESSPIPSFDSDRFRRHRVRRLVRTIAIAFVVLFVLVLPTLISQIPDDNPVTPGTTVVTTPNTAVPESFEWPTVVAGDFMHGPSGPVGGVRTSDLNSDCYACLLTVLTDGRVLKIAWGGMAETWDPVTGIWSTAGTAIGFWGFGEGYPNAVLLDDGRVLIVGLLDPNGDQPFIQIFDPETGSFHSISNSAEVVGSGLVKLSDGRVLIGQGLSGGLIYDPAEDSVTPTGRRRGPPPDTGIALADGRALLLRGSNLSIYDPATDRFRGVGTTYPVASHPDARMSLAALADGRVLITGGALIDENGGEPQALADAAVFDPVSETVTPVGPMLDPRAGHSTMTLPNGRVVIIGGGARDRVEVFNPSTETFQAAPALSRPRDRHSSAVLLQDGNVLVVGGVDQWHRFYAVDLTTPLTAEIYHPDGTVSTTSKGSVSGVTFGFEIDDLPIFQVSGNVWASAHIVIPPGGLEGATRAQLRSGHEDHGLETRDFYSDETAPPDLPTDEFNLLPDDCRQGCEIDERFVRLGAIRNPFTVHFHIQYAGQIPAEAEGITLTIEVVNEEGEDENIRPTPFLYP